ncbi:MAG TPA: hypothetical protein VID48_02875 [Solirubrobacteraceae bacterium]|jgi:glutamate formiminotransferase/glutamate formiminotransferase/formiminotetrahydrofolate cyclodeaminase
MANRNRLLAVPNVSEGRDQTAIQAIADAFTEGGEVELLDLHSDADHHRSVYTLAGDPGSLANALAAGAALAIQRIDVSDGRGVHPHVGAVDVVPLVYPCAESQGAACAEALACADMIGERLHVPVFLYGALAQGRTRAQLRAGGVQGLASRIDSGQARPDFGPAAMHPTAGATLLGARAPLVAFNLQLAAPASIHDASRIAGLIREGGGEGLAGVRALGMRIGEGVPQVSVNIERPLEVPIAAVVEAVRKHAEVVRGELVGLAPRGAMEGFPPELPLPGFDPSRHLIENALGF